MRSCPCLDVHLRREISLDVPHGANMLIYVIEGAIVVRADGREKAMAGAHAVALHGEGLVVFGATEPPHVVVLAGTAIREPVLVHGSFIMNDPSQIEAAMARYQSGGMGRLGPLTGDE